MGTTARSSQELLQGYSKGLLLGGLKQTSVRLWLKGSVSRDALTQVLRQRLQEPGWTEKLEQNPCTSHLSQELSSSHKHGQNWFVTPLRCNSSWCWPHGASKSEKCLFLLIECSRENKTAPDLTQLGLESLRRMEPVSH